MSLLTSSIDLDMIAPPLTESQLQFPASEIDHLAQLFLQVGDTVRPIILRRISPISFEILEGYFEYYAAMKAQEIDDQFTAIRAYVVPPDRELAILSQYQFLRSLSTPLANEKTDSLPITPSERQSDLEKIEQTIEQTIERTIANRLDQKIAATIERIVEEKIGSSFQAMTKQITNQITQQLDIHLSEIKRSLLLTPVTPPVAPPINQIIESSAPPVETILESVTKKPSKSTRTNQPKTRSSGSSPTKSAIKESDPKVIEVLRELNTLNFGDLEYKLLKSRSKKFARPIYELRLQQPDQKFQSILDITKVEGIAEKTILKIIAAW
ncbi:MULTISPECIES: hypothetical protein [Pseudanabaena]|uniref:Chromosome partitioning protein ParB n=2 Tax=Pseudanabaena TaxID=1152 RepID=L8MZW7_9CYAN|nr:MULTISPECIES: hypothetical protein [Pseudanabaena]ELS32035.1 hypothetical protein Pse7429DRAFT_2790 [Pseudanabaena biceps PCC 7429]MDG3495720.1 hypothetical protein [Pseudanabaena catenata USMAC16]